MEENENTENACIGMNSMFDTQYVSLYPDGSDWLHPGCFINKNTHVEQLSEDKKENNNNGKE